MAVLILKKMGVNTSFDTPSDIGDYLMETSGKWTLACLLL